VLQALLSSHRPLGAYEVIDELAKSMPRPAPITVYRALDFLMDNGPRPPHRKPQCVSRLRA
jgi:Fur family zinc uptake transcriptional regulator